MQIHKIGASAASQHAIFLSTDGEVYVYGNNAMGQCGMEIGIQSLMEPVKLERRHFAPPLSKGERIIDAAAGAAHSLLVTSTGRVYAAGSNQHGQCGIGKRKSAAPFVRVEAWKNVTQVSCGGTFSLALAAGQGVCFADIVYATGSSQFGQLGTNQIGAFHVSATSIAWSSYTKPGWTEMDMYIPGVIIGLESLDAARNKRRLNLKLPNERIKRAFAGHNSTVCLDKSGTFWIAGKTRSSGDGGLGQPYLIFKPLEVLEGLDSQAVAMGKDAFYCLAREPAEDAPTLAYAWGQDASHCELGSRRIPAEPQLMSGMNHLEVVGVASGATASYWLVKPNKAYGDLPRFPLATQSSDACLLCHSARDDQEMVLLACDRCENPCHLSCLDPPLATVPEGEWFCKACDKQKSNKDTSVVQTKRRRL